MSISDKIRGMKAELTKIDDLENVEYTHETYQWPFLSNVSNFVRGVSTAITDAVQGAFELVKYVANPSNWTDVIELSKMFDMFVTEDELNKRVELIASTDDVVKYFANNIKTTYEEEGLAYCVGYVVPELTLSFLTSGGSITSKLGKTDDVINVVGKTDKIDDIVDIGKVGKKFDDISELNKLDQLAEEMATFNPKTKSTFIKGNYGEYRTVSEISSGNIPLFESYDLHPIEGFDNLPDGLATIPKKGIDHLYANGNPPPEYIVVESKYNTSQLRNKTKDGRQMGKEWIDKRLDKIGVEAETETGENNYRSYLSRVDTKGNVTIKELNKAGYIKKYI